ncbi:MAG: hypothetical protein GC152_14320 [Alphaproteobacteria bacterium]|nr:hypothetical protein [Alphaproteobacteria bacterium]
MKNVFFALLLFLVISVVTIGWMVSNSGAADPNEAQQTTAVQQGPCSDEESFIKSDVVFWAKAGAKDERSRLLEVKELYKAPQTTTNAAQFSIRTGGIHGQEFPEESEWIVFADIEENGETPRIVASECGKILPAPDSYVSLIKESSIKNGPLVFVGKAIRATHQLSSNGGRKRIASKIDFKIEDVIGGETTNREAVKKGELQVATDCGANIELAEEYLISAHMRYRHWKDDSGERLRELEYTMSCDHRNPIYMNIITKLRSLSSLYQKK